MFSSSCSSFSYVRMLAHLFLLVAMLSTLGMATKRQPEQQPDDWATFKRVYGKKYGSAAEELMRRSNRQRNVDAIRAHNNHMAGVGGRHRFTLRENSLIDMTPQEYRALLGYKYIGEVRSTTANPRARQYGSTYPPPIPVYRNTYNIDSLPSCVNWTERGWVGSVKNQGRCGACWAFSATGSLQAQYYNHTQTRVVLSEQNLIDCTGPQGNLGCNGGNMYIAFWFVNTHGIEASATYPDKSSTDGGSRTWPCVFNANRSITQITSWRNVEMGSELALQQAVALVGPVSVGIDASPYTFMSYGGGIYYSTLCQSAPGDLNHAVLVVGYGVYDNQPYWLIQNSWGTSWGINGYMMLARNRNNTCGIATSATFPVIRQSSPLFTVRGSSSCLTVTPAINTAPPTVSTRIMSLIIVSVAMVMMYV